MKRVNILWLLLDSLFLIVFNLMFFLLSDVENLKTSAWISYGFIHFSYLVLLLTPCYVRRGSADYMYRRPPYVVTSSYFLVALLAGVIFILVAPETNKVTIIIQVILAAIFLGWLLVYLIANEHTANNIERREKELQYVKESSAKLFSVIQHIATCEIEKNIKQLYDLIHSSPTKSSPEVSKIEKEIMIKIEALCLYAKDYVKHLGILNSDIVSGIDAIDYINGQTDFAKQQRKNITNLSSEIYHLAEERNIKLKLLNN